MNQNHNEKLKFTVDTLQSKWSSFYVDTYIDVSICLCIICVWAAAAATTKYTRI